MNDPESNAPSGTERRSRELLWVLPLFLLSMALHGWGVGSKALWYDEVTTALYAAKSPLELWRFLTAFDFHPPLFFLLQKPFVASALTPEWSLRIIPLLACGAAVFMAEVTARRLGASRWVGGLLTAFFPGLMVYAQEARAYSLLVALQFAALYAMVRMREEPDQPRRWIMTVVALLWLSAAVHYLSLLFILPIVGMLLVWSRRKVFTFLCLAVAAALYAPWFPALYRSTFGGTAPLSEVAPRVLSLLNYWEVFSPHWGAGAAAVAACLGAGWVLFSLRRKPGVLLVGVLLAFPMVFFTLLPPRYAFFTERYFLPWAALPLLLLGLVRNQKISKPGIGYAPLLLLPWFAWQSFQLVSAPRVWNRELAGIVEEQFESGDMVLVYPYYQMIPIFYYLPLSEESRADVFGNPLYMYSSIVVDVGNKALAFSSSDDYPLMVGNIPLNGRTWLLQYGPTLGPLEGWRENLVAVKVWPQATLYRLNRRLRAVPEAGQVYLGDRPVSRWGPFAYKKQR